MASKALSREEKAKVLGVDIGDASNRAKPLGRIQRCEDGVWRWRLTRSDDGIEHRLCLVADDPTAFGVWLRSDNHINLLKGQSGLTITTSEWVRIAKAAQDAPAEGIADISYHAVSCAVGPARTSSARVSVPEAARVLGVTHETVRRRIRSGKLSARRVRYGNQWHYVVDLSTGATQAEMPITEAPVEPLIAPAAHPAPRMSFVEPTPTAIPAPAPTAQADATIEIIMSLFQRLDAQRQSQLLQGLMKVWAI